MDNFNLMRYKKESSGGFAGEGMREINALVVWIYGSYGQYLRLKE